MTLQMKALNSQAATGFSKHKILAMGAQAQISSIAEADGWRAADPDGPRLTLAIACRAARHLEVLVTPDAELVVAPAGYSLKATMPASLAACTSSAVVSSVR